MRQENGEPRSVNPIFLRIFFWEYIFQIMYFATVFAEYSFMKFCKQILISRRQERGRGDQNIFFWAYIFLKIYPRMNIFFLSIYFWKYIPERIYFSEYIFLSENISQKEYIFRNVYFERGVRVVWFGSLGDQWFGRRPTDAHFVAASIWWDDPAPQWWWWRLRYVHCTMCKIMKMIGVMIMMLTMMMVMYTMMKMTMAKKTLICREVIQLYRMWPEIL